MKNFLLVILFILSTVLLLGQEQKESTFFNPIEDYPSGLKIEYNTGFSKQIFHKLYFLSYGLSSEYDDFFKPLTNAWYNNLSLTYFLPNNPTLGFGIKYDLSNSRSSSSKLSLDINNELISTGNISRKVNYGFIGPSISTRILFLNKNMFYSNIALGAMYYIQKDNSFNQGRKRDIVTSSSGLAIRLELAYEYLIDRHWALGFNATLNGAGFGAYSLIEEGNRKEFWYADEKAPSLSVINTGFGLKYSF